MRLSIGLDLPFGVIRRRRAPASHVPQPRLSISQPRLLGFPEIDLQSIRPSPELPERHQRDVVLHLDDPTYHLHYSQLQPQIIQPSVLDIAQLQPQIVRPNVVEISPTRSSRSRSRSRCCSITRSRSRSQPRRREQSVKIGPLEYRRSTYRGESRDPRRRSLSRSIANESPRATRYICQAQPDPLYDVIVESRRHRSRPRSRSRSRSSLRVPAVRVYRTTSNRSSRSSSLSASSASSSISSSASSTASSTRSSRDSVSSKASSISSDSSPSSVAESLDEDEPSTTRRGRSRKASASRVSAPRTPSTHSYVRTSSRSPTARSRSNSSRQPPRSILKNASSRAPRYPPSPSVEDASDSDGDGDAHPSSRLRGGGSPRADNDAKRMDGMLKVAAYLAGNQRSRRRSR